MLLSEMFGVKRDADFGVEGVYGKFQVINNGAFETLVVSGGKGEYDTLVQSRVLLNIIAGAPANIIHLPPPLTDEQRVVLMSLFTMGARYMGMSRDGWKRCFVNKPQKEFGGWTCVDTQCLTIASGMANCLDSLVSWFDPEPYDIAKALGVEG